MTDRTEALRVIRDEILALADSPLYEYRVKNKYFPVVGEGDHFAKIMFIGEAPGRNEAKTGRPFCGAAGKVLDELLAGANIDRKDAYITNIVKDRPPLNRDPLPEEIEAYGPFLDRQINIIQPAVIATLGRYAMQYVMTKFGLAAQLDVISKMHGKSFQAEAQYGPVKIVPLYHPAVAVYDASKKPVLIEDFKIIKSIA
ncbi:MAG TPA: uracil-DNA glycosylase [Candidatus Paceibacterota bacterium]|nr:uracil-DNA glycosylase [Candidatus Paceibacterota bacterium]